MELTNAKQIRQAGSNHGSCRTQPEVCQEDRHTAWSGEGVQRGRCGDEHSEKEEIEVTATLDDLLIELKAIRKDQVTVRTLVGEALFALRDAEREIPERIRRFSHHMHSIHDIKYMHEELGVPPPDYLLRELERVDDRFRQLIAEENAEGGSFSKVRREMATDPKNRYDHTRQLAAPTHTKEVLNEAGKSVPLGNGLDKG